MKLKDIGEFGFIEGFAHKFDHLISGDDMGIGDDCAILSVSEAENHVITTDLLIEDVHFLKNKISPQELGYKSLAVNLSDIAAMGAQPLYSFLSIGIPKETDIEYLNGFMEGYHQLSSKYNTPLMGGDTTKSMDKLVVNVAVVGRVEKPKTKMRSMAQNGDVICVSGFLGDSAGGLKILLDRLELNEQNMQLVRRHHLPEPMIKEAVWLANHNEVHAMMDISDGISSDLKHILKASGQSASIDIEQLPVSPLLNEVGKKHGWNSYGLASSGGEDYELLFTVKESRFEKINDGFKAKFGKPLYPIGYITEGKPEIRWSKNGKPVDSEGSGFDHFK